MMTMTYEYLAQCHNLQLMSVFVRNFNPEFSVASSDVFWFVRALEAVVTAWNETQLLVPGCVCVYKYAGKV